MILEGLKFGLGIMMSMFAVSGIVLGTVLVGELVNDRKMKLVHNKRRMEDSAGTVSARPNQHLLLVRYPARIDGPTDSAQRKQEYLQ